MWSIIGQFRLVGASQNVQTKHIWGRLFFLTLFTTYFYVLMEWLFFVTKPSFMDVVTIWEKFNILVNTSLILTVPWLLLFLLLFGMSNLPVLSKKQDILLYAAGLYPAAILSITTLLLVDNFTYTLFQFGIVSTKGITRIIYALFTLVALTLWLRWIIHRLNASKPPQVNNHLNIPSILGIGMIIISATLTIPKLIVLNNLKLGGETGDVIKRPHILLIGSDGVNASNTSLYGYDRDTTPNLRHLSDESLLAENAFTNSSKTSGSIISIFTSKLPTQTRVIYPPDILRNADSYQHLPGILHRNGYRTIEISVSHYIDAYTLNVLDGFDVVNDRSLDQAGFIVFTQSTVLQDAGYFLSALVERVSDRMLHIFFIREMSNNYQEVTEVQFPTKDRSRVRRLIKYLKEADQPLFIHVHLMGTHGDKFMLEKQLFSTGQTQDSSWMTDFYDDAILEFDDYIGEVVSELSKLGIFDSTILVIYSDHGQNYHTEQRVPLLFHFPSSDFSGQIRSNVQNLDIAPTILDYLGLPVPQWMEGQSLLTGEPDPNRPIFSSGAGSATSDENGYWALDLERILPPFYQFAYLRAIICQKWYLIDLIDYRLEQGEVVGHTAPCTDESLPDQKAVQTQMIERLESDGFDTSTLQQFFSTLQP
jgi:hypothetical protein